MSRLDKILGYLYIPLHNVEDKNQSILIYVAYPQEWPQLIIIFTHVMLSVRLCLIQKSRKSNKPSNGNTLTIGLT